MSDQTALRSSYHHGDLRAQLIAAVRDLVEAHGPDGFSVAEAARRAGVSSAAPYKHFKDRPELLRAVAGEGMDRLRAAMEAALEADCDVIGLGRPLCCQPDFPRRLLAREVESIERIEDRLRFADRGWRSPASPLVAAKMLNAFGAQAWYYCQLFRLADGRTADLGRGMLSSLAEYLRDELSRGR